MLMEHIIIFYKVAAEKSISKVAQANHISQPALSQQMQRLEEELNVKLFERSNRGIELTKAGVILQKYAEGFIQSYEYLKEELENLKADKGTFRIAATPVACNYALPCTLYRVSKEFPDYSFSLNCFPSSEITQQIQTEQADLGFSVKPVTDSSIVCNKAYTDRIHLVVNTNYKGKLPHDIKDLKKHPLIMLNEISSTYRLLVNYLEELGCPIEQLNVSYHLNSTEAVKNAVLAGHGFAFLPYMSIKKEVYLKEIQIIELPNITLDYDIYSLYRADKNNVGDSTKKITQYLVNTINQSIC